MIIFKDAFDTKEKYFKKYFNIIRLQLLDKTFLAFNVRNRCCKKNPKILATQIIELEKL